MIDDLQSGALPGDQVPGVGIPVFKVRIRNSDAAKGKRGGYRLLYYLQTSAAIISVTIYSKSEQSDVSAGEIRRILREIS